jgi:hypothetical protein
VPCFDKGNRAYALFDTYIPKEIRGAHLDHRERVLPSLGVVGLGAKPCGHVTRLTFLFKNWP